MTLLIIGLVLFLGIHSTRIVADDWRSRFIAQRGERTWKLLYTVVSIIGFVLIVRGYAAARLDPVVLYTPPLALRHASSLFTLVGFVLLAAAYVPRNHLRRAVGHPMVAGAKTWAFGHLLANGTLADVLLFGGFLAWAIADFASARRRDRAAGASKPPAGALGTVLTLVGGAIAWFVFAKWLHGPLIGVAPFGA